MACEIPKNRKVDQKAPMGYSNQSTQEGRKIIEPKFPEADLIRWAFEQFAKGTFSIRKIRAMTLLFKMSLAMSYVS